MTALVFAFLVPTAASAVAPPALPGAVPPAPDGAVVALAPIVGGNAATAKQRALSDALRQSVEHVLTAILVEAGLGDPLSPGLIGLKTALPAGAKRFVRGYRLLDQSEVDGMLRLQLVADVDDALLRREVERLRGPTAASRLRPTLVAIVKLGPTAADTEGTLALAAVLGAAGVKTAVGQEILTGTDDDAGLRRIVGRVGAAAVLAVTASNVAEGSVRGTNMFASQCRMAIWFFPLGGGTPIAGPTAEGRAFAETADRAQSACFKRSANDLCPEVVRLLVSANVSSPDARLLTLTLDLVEPAALGPVLRTLRKMGSVTSSEVRRVAVGAVEIRVATRATPVSLGAALAQALRGTLDVEASASTLDTMNLKIRIHVAPPAVPDARPPPVAQ